MSTYTTIQGDMWDSIAAAQMGSASYVGELMRVNQRYLSYYIFPAGVVLTIPDVDASAQASDTLPPWKKVNA